MSPAIYTASKTVHAPRWREMRAAGWSVISTWIDEAGAGETACFEDLWKRCIGEAASADAVLLYREPGEVLKGAFIEAGAALASGKPVHAVGCAEFSFVSHPLVVQHPDLVTKRIAELEAERDDLLDKLDARISMHHDIEEVLDDTLAALREIAWSRPLGPTRSKAIERLERIAIDALGAASSPPNKEYRNG